MPRTLSGNCPARWPTKYPDTHQGGGTSIAIKRTASVTDEVGVFRRTLQPGKYIYLAHNEPRAVLVGPVVPSITNDRIQYKTRVTSTGWTATTLVTAVPNTFTIGIADDTRAFATNAATIDGEYTIS